MLARRKRHWRPSVHGRIRSERAIDGNKDKALNDGTGISPGRNWPIQSVRRDIVICQHSAS
jgi:hypothetical protein